MAAKTHNDSANTDCSYNIALKESGLLCTDNKPRNVHSPSSRLLKVELHNVKL